MAAVTLSEQTVKGRPWSWFRAHPRVTGIVLAVLLGVGYVLLIRPGREAFAEQVALPLFDSIGTERAQEMQMEIRPQRPESVFVVSAERTIDWSAPVGMLFAFPAMFLIAVFPFKKYWLYLLLYHVLLGVTGIVLFMVGIAWLNVAFDVYLFARTYFAETVSLAVPVLLYLAGKKGGALFTPSQKE